MRHHGWGLASLFSLYILWGATFIGIRLAVETIPPLIAGCARHACGGVALVLCLLILRRWVPPSFAQWRNAFFVGGLTAGLSNAALMTAELHVPSSYAAIAFTTMPLFLLVFNWLAFERVAHSVFDFIAMPVGLLGSGLVVSTGESLSGGSLSSFDTALLVLSPSLWAFGSLLGRRISMPHSILVSATLQMAGGSILLAALSWLNGDWTTFQVDQVTMASFWGFLYLAIGGSLVGYTAFAVAIRNLDSRLVGTYAFINPLIAVGIGFLIGEPVGQPSVITGGALAVFSVLLTFIGAGVRRGRRLKGE